MRPNCLIHHWDISKEPHTLIRGQADASLDVAHEAFLRNWLHDDRRPDTPAAAGEERSWPWLAAERTVVRALEGVVDRYREWKQRHSDPQLLLSDMELQRWRDWGGSERNLAWYRRYAPILAGIEPLPEVPSEEDLRRRISQLQLFWNHSRAAVDHAMDERFRQRAADGYLSTA